MLKDAVNLISKPHQSQNKIKNQIFIVDGWSQLEEWNYDYSRLLYALDFGEEVRFRFDYTLGAYVKSIGVCSLEERAKRINQVSSNKIGRYSFLSK